jgi:hypothetical protein
VSALVLRYLAYQHLDADCDGNTETIVHAARSEMEKIQRLRRELADTLDSLHAEQLRIEGELPSFEDS